MVKKTEGTVLWSLLQKGEGLVANHIVGMSAQAQRDAVGDHLRVLILALPRKDDPLIEASRFGLQMPLPTSPVW